MSEVVQFRARVPRGGLEPLWRELVGAELRRRRLARRARLVDVAARAGVSSQYLSELERGRKDPSSEVLAAVAGALGASVLDLTAAVVSTGRAPSTTVPPSTPAQVRLAA
ncbi:helix-turn-helix domain-containing protein [Aquipuribacter nitratireducens]|uniref:Helix-turn-helix domain-containing protein n=1 Tax=Aquipuribacter nitratireducens TaxID=650104 RepID=A0ABW0GTX9_9MICO